MGTQARKEFRKKVVRMTPDGRIHKFTYGTPYGWPTAIATFTPRSPVTFRRAGVLAPGHVLARAQKMAAITRELTREHPYVPGVEHRIATVRYAINEARSLRLASTGHHLP